MKIAIIGYSGSGKSTLARYLSEKENIPVLHLDTVQWLPGWESRDKHEKEKIVLDFLDSNDAWVIDGNYTKLYQERRLEEADIIIEMLFGRFDCYNRCKERYIKYKGKNRPDMTAGCDEKLDKEFKRWIFFGGRTKEIRKHYKDIKSKYFNKTVVLRNQKELDKFIANI